MLCLWTLAGMGSSQAQVLELGFPLAGSKTVLRKSPSTDDSNPNMTGRWAEMQRSKQYVHPRNTKNNSSIFHFISKIRTSAIYSK